jgi:DNA-directed RNA polymerase specialized sigma24 family protein
LNWNALEVEVSVRQQPVKDFRSDYATRTDFCDAFTNHTRSFYLLAFLLTRSHAAAENCLVDTIEQAFKPDTVFREWTTSWIKRTLIARAITTVFDASNPGEQSADNWYGDRSDGRRAIDAITRLADLERFVFVMSVLESYSVHECSILLGCPGCVVVESRTRALHNLPVPNSSADEDCGQSVRVTCSKQKSA